VQVPTIIADSGPHEKFRLPLIFGLGVGLIVKLSFGILGAMAYK